MAIIVIAMLLVGCLTDPQTIPNQIAKTVTFTPTLITQPSTYLPGTPSSTPVSTVTTTPTPANTSTTIPIRQINLPNDVLFLSDGRLMRWSHSQSMIRPTVIDVVSYSASQDGSKVAVLRKTGITANAVETFDLTVLDTRNGDFVTLLDSISRLNAVQISPDGRWIAIVNELQQLYLLPADGTDTGAKISECQSSQAGECDDLAWSADSLEVVWDTADGIWQAGPGSLLPSQVISNQLDIPDPKGQLISKQVKFHGLSWSPFGRYILTRIQPVGSDVSWQAIIDASLHRIVEIPDTYRLDEPTALAFWLSNGNLLVIHSASIQASLPLALESWQILPTSEDILNLDFRRDIPVKWLEDSHDNQSWNGLPTVASQVSDRTLSMALNSSRVDGPGRLFTFDIKYGILNKITDLPAHIVKIFWTPDGNAALVLGSDDSLIYVPADGSFVSDVTARFGSHSCCFTWLADETNLP